jgi:hypothetical protein
MDRGRGGWDKFELNAISLGVLKDSCVKFFSIVCSDCPKNAFLNYMSTDMSIKGRKLQA